jgi:hypothetical protein
VDGPVTLVVEGTIDEAVARRLLAEAGLACGPVHVRNGKAALDRRLRGYSHAARFACWLVLRDLDHDASCAPELLRELLPDPAGHLRLHLAVRSVEAWLLADAEALGRFLRVAPTRVPPQPDAVPFPKRTMVELARRSRNTAIREAMVPATNSTAKVGPGYAVLLGDFISQHWRPGIAARRSPSLARLRGFLRRARNGGPSPAGCSAPAPNGA